MGALSAGLRSGGFDGFPPSFFRLGAWSIGIQRGLLAVFLDSLFYDAVRNGQHTIHQRREFLVLV